MARPTKSAKVLTECSQTKDEIEARVEQEEILKGKTDKIKPHPKLTPNQKKIFKYITSELEESKLLGNLDIYLLNQTSIAIDRLQEIEFIINEKPKAMFSKVILAAKEKYSKDFYRGMNELCLSPQSRAKLANITMQGQKDKKDPLLQVLDGEDDEE